MISIVLIFGVLWVFRNETWTHFATDFPLWSYLTFTQNIFMAMTGDVGAYWAAPSWTLALEEQLYIVLPLVFFLAPRRTPVSFSRPTRARVVELVDTQVSEACA